MIILEKIRRQLRDALPGSWGLCLTLRANPVLGWLFLHFRKQFHLEGMAFEVPLKNQSLSSLATYWFNDYELPERNFCRRYIRPTDSVCELGGCLGVVSMIINRTLKAPAKHVVVEANPQLVPLLKKNRDLNGGNFEVINRAVGDGSPIKLDVSSGLLTSHQSAGSKTIEVTVEGCTVGELAAQYGSFDVLVMDVEGAEQQVLLGQDESWKMMRTIIIEWHPTLIGDAVFQQAKEALRDAGFSCSDSQAGDLHVVEVWERNQA